MKKFKVRGIRLALIAILCASAHTAIAQFAAIAYSPTTGRYGYSFGFATQFEAVQYAEYRCRISDCQSVVWTSNGCASLYRAFDTSMLYGTGWASDLPSAQYLARVQCESNSNTFCVPVTWVCSN